MQSRTANCNFADRVAHVSLATFILDSAVASYVGKPVYQSTTPGPINEEGLDEWSPWHDPLAPNMVGKMPSKACSNINALATMVSREPTVGVNTPTLATAVTALAHNAASGNARVQPTVLLAQLLCQPRMPTVASHQDHQPEPAPFTSSIPFMSIPGEATDATLSPSVTNSNQGTGGLFSPSVGTIAGRADDAPNDIFEEFAMLERTDSSQYPMFMQNLGFGPELDLAEFFGPDYQPSDPLLPAYGPPLHSYSESNAQSGAG